MNSISTFFSHHGKHLMTLTFVGGFFLDFFTLPDISNPLYPYVGLVYIGIVATSILIKEWIMHALSIGRGSHRIMQLVSLVGSFFLGSLLSYIFIYYLRSSDIFTSWPLYLFLVFCAVVNEVSFQTSTRLLINVTFLYICIIFFTIFNLPLVYKEVSDTVFAKSIVLGSLISYLYAAILGLTVYNKKLVAKIYVIALLVPMAIGAMYFANITPAVPLALRDAKVYKHVAKVTDGYQFTDVRQAEERLFGLKYRDYVFVDGGSTLYFFAAVVAPAKVGSKISHVWQKKDTSGQWVTMQDVDFPIVGGRKQGYRGYTLMNNISKGEWRVLVKVGGNRTVGQKKFIVE